MDNVNSDVGELSSSPEVHPQEALGSLSNAPWSPLSQLPDEVNSYEVQSALVRAINEVSLNGILAVNQDQIIISHNQRFLEIWNLPQPSNLVGTNDAPILAFVLDQLKDPEAFLKRVQTLYGDSHMDDYCELELKDGRTLERRSRALHGEGGQYWGRVWFFSDITARKKAEAALRQSELRFRRLVESNIIGVFVGNTYGQITEANEHALQMLGYERADLDAGKLRWDQIAQPENQQDSLQIQLEIIAGGITSPMETEYVRKDGGRVPVLIGLASLGNSEGEAIGIVLDLTNRMKIEEEMRRAKEAAEFANRTKSEFLANMSHEIRTPMNGILGTLDLVMDTPLGSGQREYLGLAKTSADSLLGILNDILDISKIEAGKLELNPVEFALRHGLEATTRLFSARAREKGLKLTYEVRDDVPDTLVGDELRLRQVIANLLGNAVKFTERGEVTLVVALAAPLLENRISLLCTVRDTGLGIPPERQQMIFEPFRQADSSTTRKFAGTGLGLTICARLVELMGGRIWVESEPHKGSVFHFTAEFELGQTKRHELPVHSPMSASAVPQTAQTSLRILLAEDNYVNQVVAFRLLEKRGHRVTVAQTGPDVLRELAGGSFDVILMDVHMPGMDGLEVTATIREGELKTGSHLPIIAMTASAMQGDKERCLAAGMDGYISKPIDAEKLFEYLGKVAACAFNQSR